MCAFQPTTATSYQATLPVQQPSRFLVVTAAQQSAALTSVMCAFQPMPATSYTTTLPVQQPYHFLAVSAAGVLGQSSGGACSPRCCDVCPPAQISGAHSLIRYIDSHKLSSNIACAAALPFACCDCCRSAWTEPRWCLQLSARCCTPSSPDQRLSQPQVPWGTCCNMPEQSIKTSIASHVFMATGRIGQSRSGACSPQCRAVYPPAQVNDAHSPGCSGVAVAVCQDRASGYYLLYMHSFLVLDRVAVVRAALNAVL